MIVTESIDRFASNFGRMPTSIALAADWTTPLSASNLELAGSSFSSEKDFGDGLSGLGDTSGATPASDFLASIPDWNWQDWAIAIGLGYTLYNILGFAKGKAIETKQGISRRVKRVFKRKRTKVSKGVDWGTAA